MNVHEFVWPATVCIVALFAVVALWLLCRHGYKEIEHESKLGKFTSKIKARK